METYKESEFIKAGILDVFKQDNQSTSIKGVLRGLHMQTENTQSKLIRVLHGSIYDVIVDLRKNSETFKHWQGFELSAKNKTMLYVPEGFAHGFLSLEDGTEFFYRCDKEYAPSYELVIDPFDPSLAIDWDNYKNDADIENYIISTKDKDNKISLTSFPGI